MEDHAGTRMGVEDHGRELISNNLLPNADYSAPSFLSSVLPMEDFPHIAENDIPDQDDTWNRMGVLGLQNHARELISNNIFDPNADYCAPSFLSFMDVQSPDTYVLPMDAFSHSAEKDNAIDNELPLDNELLENADPLGLTNFLNFFGWDNDLLEHPDPLGIYDPFRQSTSFEFPTDFSVPSSTFQERQAALAAQVLKPWEDIAAVQAEEVQPPDQGFSIVNQEMPNFLGNIEDESTNITELHADVVASNVFNSISPHCQAQSPPLNVDFLQPPQCTLPSPSDSYDDIFEESASNRKRTSGYKIEDLRKKLQRGSALGLSNVGSNEKNSLRDTSLAVAEFQSDPNLSSHKVSSSSVLSSLKDDSADEKQQLYCDQAEEPQSTTTRRRKKIHVKTRCLKKHIPLESKEPQSTATRRRRKIQEKTLCLKKLIPQESKLDTAAMFKEACKYLKVLQAQVHVLECMPPWIDHRSVGQEGRNVGQGAGMTSSRNVKDDSSENLSTRQMLHVLVTSHEIQKKLLKEERCVGTLQQYQMVAASEQMRGNHATVPNGASHQRL